MMRRRFINTFRMSGCVCLTFDDGPHPESTPKILELLEKTGVRATFFLLGENVEKHPDIVAKIVSHGHEIGAHGYSHLHPWKSDPYNSLLDLIKGDKIIKQCKAPESNRYFRPPYGKFNLITLLYVLITKRKVVFWNVDPKDYKETLAERVPGIAQRAKELGVESIAYNSIDDLVRILETSKDNLCLECATRI